MRPRHAFDDARRAQEFRAYVGGAGGRLLHTATLLFRTAQEIAAFSLEFMVIYLEAALIYWLFCLVLSFGQGRIERRLDRRVAH